MPRELMAAAAAPAMAPTASVAAAFSFKFLLRFVRTLRLEVKVIGAWVVWFFLRLLQSVFGPRRRRSRHGSVQYTAMAVYYLPTLVAFFAAKEMYSSSNDDSGTKALLSFGCCILLFLCARGAVTMTAFTLDHGPDRVQNWRLIPWLVYFAWLQGGSIWLDGKLTALDVYSFFIFFGPVLYLLLAKPRAAVLDYETKQFADYMAQHNVLFDGDENNLYDGCRYPFMQLEEDQWKNFSDVLQLLPRDDCAADRDNCLSYIFCRLLARRYFGFPCAEDGNAQVRDFVLTELLAENNNRAFTIVEVQLALLHDYFFTNFLSNIASGFLSVKEVVRKLLYESLIYAISYAVAFLINGLFTVRVFALTVIFTILLTAIRQPQYPFLPRYWRPIRKLLQHFRKEEDIVDVRSASPRSQQSSPSSYYWRDKMGQYSVMEDYDRRSFMKVVMAWFKIHVLSQASYSFIIKHHPAESKDVSVSDNLKKFLAHTIKDLDGPPTIGARSLDDFSWTCRQDDTLTDTILIWHIATCYCDMSQQPLDEETVPQSLQQNMSQPLEEPSTGDGKVATTLSRYCAYLVAFLPELLPEHSLTVKVVLQKVLQEARDVLGTTRVTMEEKGVLQQVLQQARDLLIGTTGISMEKRVKIQQHQLPEEESSMNTFQKGVRLGRQLEQQQDVSLRWKTMANFWAEMILYVASSSDNAAAHIELLAQGGEFLTHIWALLCNAGMVREQKAASA